MTVLKGAARKGKVDPETRRCNILLALSNFGPLSHEEAALIAPAPLSTAKRDIAGLKTERLITKLELKRPGGAGRPRVRHRLALEGYDYLIDAIGDSAVGAWRDGDGETPFSNSPKHKAGSMRSLIAAWNAAVRSQTHQITKIWSGYRPNEAIKTARKGRPGAVRRETTLVGKHEKGITLRLSSDGAFLADIQTDRDRQTNLFNLEWDQRTEEVPAPDGIDGLNQNTIAGKIRLYVHFMLSGGVNAHFGQPLSYVLFLAEEKDRVRRMANALDWSKLPPLGNFSAADLFRFTTLQEAEADFFGPVWVAPNQSEPVALGGGS